MTYCLNLKNIKQKNIYDLGAAFYGTNPSGDEISFTNYYMKKNGKPFFGISGELHFSRMEESRWEDELIKMKMGGINIVSTYVIWIHHEEFEGEFDFNGRRNLRRFVQLCEKHGLYVILRVGPFAHGEVRNGGIPDWCYGKPFEVRSLDEGFMNCARIWYEKIGEQVKDLFFHNDGPVIGVQIDNEYMHSAAPWEMTTGISNEWLPSGRDGDAYMVALQNIAAESGLLPVFYTCTGWGGAATPDSMMPLWGGYSFRPWLFYSQKGDHPATDEYVYQDFHNNQVICNYDFHPGYAPETRPYACCEMGGGMMCSYYYRFRFDYKSVDAMANIKIASGGNFLGYYMYHGGTNPLGKYGTYMNEGQVTKVSYDYQAALGEFGQVRESYQRMKTIHQFVNAFGDRFCGLQTVLPEGASHIDPRDKDTLRYAVRTDGQRGFLFVNNYQDHCPMHDKKDESVCLELDSECIEITFSVASGENCILPFHFDLNGIDLSYATAQVVTKVPGETDTYVFVCPDGMKPKFVFENSVKIDAGHGKADACVYCSNLMQGADLFSVTKDSQMVRILVVDREHSNQMYQLQDGTLLFTPAAVLEADGKIRIETTDHETLICRYPSLKEGDILSEEIMKTVRKTLVPICKEVSEHRYIIEIPEESFDGVKDLRLQIDYKGDIGHAFINGRMINDNFYNTDTWEIGLKEWKELLKEYPITIYLTPIKEGAFVNVESAMAARKEEVAAMTAEISAVTLCPVYEITL